jgi:hypothetical protein
MVGLIAQAWSNQANLRSQPVWAGFGSENGDLIAGRRVSREKITPRIAPFLSESRHQESL